MRTRASNVSGVFQVPPNKSLDHLRSSPNGLTKAGQEIVESMATLESTFGRSGGMLQEVLGTSLRGF